MALPLSFLEHLQTSGYHSRSDKHSKALAEAIVRDLVLHCSKIAADATAGRLVYWHNHDLTFGHATWNTDLAIGPPPPEILPPEEGEVSGMVQAVPATTRIAVELKGVMTEHGKARKNRKRDLEAHHAHVHDYDASAIAGGVMVVNAASRFRSPLRQEVTQHRKAPSELVKMVADELSSVTMAGGSNRVGLDAKCLIAVDMDNIDWPTTSYFTTPPAPAVGSPLHWDSFIQRLCSLYTSRFP